MGRRDSGKKRQNVERALDLWTLNRHRVARGIKNHGKEIQSLLKFSFAIYCRRPRCLAAILSLLRQQWGKQKNRIA